MQEVELSRIYIGKSTKGMKEQILAGLDWVDWRSVIPEGARVFIKPNFTFPFYRRGVTTSPEVIEALVVALRTRTPNITIGETDGGARAWRAEEAFAGHDIPGIVGRHGVALVNLTGSPTEEVILPLRRGPLAIRLPRILLRETDVFITMPVPKIHAMTRVSLGLKNQWGCIPDAPRRFCYHHAFDEMIVHLNRLFRTRLVVGDCTFMLTGNGPMFGEHLRADMLVVADDPGAFELAMLHLMGLEKWKVGHIEEARRQGMVPGSLEGVEFNTDWRSFRSDRFYLKRTLQNYIALAGFRSRFITWLGYQSPLAGPIHLGLYAVKGNPLQRAMAERKGKP
jgi:uncharacterized protein (DUF362 family)